MASPFSKCISAILDEAVNKGGAFTAPEAEDMFREFKHTVDSLDGAKPEEKLAALRAKGEEYVNRAVTSAKLDNLRKIQYNKLMWSKLKWAKDNFKTSGEALKVFMGSTERVRLGGLNSVTNRVAAARDLVRGRLASDLQNLGPDALRLLRTNKVNRALAWKLSSLTDPTIKVPEFDKNTDHAGHKAAEIFNKYNTEGINRLNRNGAAITPLPGRIALQTHDPERMSAAGNTKWKEMAKSTIDFQRTLMENREGPVSTDNVNRFLDSMFEATTTGYRLDQAGHSDAAGRFNSSSLGDRLSKERLIHFNNPDDFLKYNDAFGKAPLYDLLKGQVEKNATDAELMAQMSHDPQGFLEDFEKKLGQTFRDSSNLEATHNLPSAANYADRVLKNLTGYTSVDTNPKVTSIVEGIKTYNNYVHLTLSAVNSWDDFARGVQQLNHMGMPAFKAMGEMVSRIADTWKLMPKEDAIEAAKQNHYVARELMYSQPSRYGDDGTGWQAKANHALFKYNLHAAQDYTFTRSIKGASSAYLGDMAQSDFSKLSRQNRIYLTQYGITEPEWNVLRQGVATMDKAGEFKYMTSEAVQAIPNEVLAKYLEGTGAKATDNAIAKAKDHFGTTLATMLTDSAQHTVPLPNASDMASLNWGLQKGTLLRGALDLVGQYKGFQVASARRNVGQLFYGKGAEKWYEALSLGEKGNLPAIASRAVIGSMMAYASYSAASFLKGLTAPPIDDPKTWGKMLIRSGTLGPMLDFATEDYGSDGSGLLKTAAGPLLSTVAQGASEVGKMRDKAAAGENPVTASTVRYAANQLGGKLPVIQPLFNYLFLYRLNNWLNPNYLDEHERKLQNDTGQKFIIPPSQYLGK